MDYQDSFYKSFRDFKGGRDDLTFAQNMDEVRNEIKKTHKPKDKEKEMSRINQIRMDMRKSAVNAFALSGQLGACPICTMLFSPNEQIKVLECHERHCVHTWCFETYL